MPLTAVGIRGMAALARPLCRGGFFTAAIRIFAYRAHLSGMLALLMQDARGCLTSLAAARGKPATGRALYALRRADGNS
jgi:hypothetical protein